MGKIFSNPEKFGSINIHTEKKNYTAGDQVNGKINLSLKKDFPSNSLYLIISGKEQVKLTTSTLSGSGEDTTSEVVVHNDENEFYGHKFLIYEFNDEIFLKGEYCFPFSFRLEDTLPGSFCFEFEENGEKCFGKIEYKIWAGLKNEEEKLVLYDNFDFFVDQQFEFSSGPTSRVFEQNLKGYCYSDLGHMKLNCDFSGDTYRVNDPANLTVGVDATKLKTDIKSIQCSLVQLITLKAKNETQTKKFDVTSISLPGLKTGEKKMGQNSLPVTLLIQTRSQKEASSNGILIQNDFKLQIKPEIENCLCCSDEPINEISVKVFNRKFDIDEGAYNFGRDDFKPKVMDGYVCTITNDYRMTKEVRNVIVMEEGIEYPEEVDGN